MTTYEIIARAIREKKAISAIYKGRRRVMCPHVIGTKNGRAQALFYQFAGESSTRRIGPPGDHSNWRCMAVDALSDVRISDSEWHSAGNHSQDQTCVGDIDLEVDY